MSTTETGRVKYPRTAHLPWSASITRDDLILHSLAEFAGKRVIVTEKMDGEGTTMYRDAIHARSLKDIKHESADRVKQFWSELRHNIPEGWRVCGENVYAQHSIHYSDLPCYFLGFSIWNEANTALSWDDTLEWFELLGIASVPLLYDGTFDEQLIRRLWTPEKTQMEGYVVRIAGSIKYEEFGRKVGKFVRPNHVQTSKDWKRRLIVANGLHR